MTEKMLKPAEVAEMFGVKRETVTEWLRSGVLRGQKIGRGYYWRVPESAARELAEKKYGDDRD